MQLKNNNSLPISSRMRFWSAYRIFSNPQMSPSVFGRWYSKKHVRWNQFIWLPSNNLDFGVIYFLIIYKNILNLKKSHTWNNLPNLRAFLAIFRRHPLQPDRALRAYSTLKGSVPSCIFGFIWFLTEILLNTNLFLLQIGKIGVLTNDVNCIDCLLKYDQ